MLWSPLRRLAVLLVLLPLLPGGGRAQSSDDPSSFQRPQDQRPADLVVLRQWQTMEGGFLIGVHGARPAANDPQARTIQLWVESPAGVKLAVDTLRCSPAAPMRLTRQGSNLLIQELNPGGAISEANRLNHQIWWAACFPEQAGKDPATLQPLARQLGYSGLLREQQQVLPGNPR